MASALGAAHAKGIVHRDVSPHNVLLSEQGEVKLTDFGIAKAMNKREQTGTGVVKGKVAFMSPEQRRRDAGERTHLGIGVATYVEMCGLAPSRVLASLSYGAGGWEAATVSVRPTGKVEVITGTSLAMISSRRYPQ